MQLLSSAIQSWDDIFVKHYTHQAIHTGNSVGGVTVGRMGRGDLETHELFVLESLPSLLSVLTSYLLFLPPAYSFHGSIPPFLPFASEHRRPAAAVPLAVLARCSYPL